MIFLEIKAKIHASKLLEFSQAKLDFIYNFQSANGFINFIEKPGNEFHIQISWENQQCLSVFIESEKFHFFKGALLALSNKNSISVITHKHL
ncbi:MAG: hypothetical protein GQ527_05435 [Bacteroidales bacterium]|nr:hypothetical protein [Bacteroidales bacterium]